MTSSAIGDGDIERESAIREYSAAANNLKERGRRDRKICTSLKPAQESMTSQQLTGRTRRRWSWISLLSALCLLASLHMEKIAAQGKSD